MKKAAEAILFYAGICVGMCIAWPPLVMLSILTLSIVFWAAPILTVVDVFSPNGSIPDDFRLHTALALVAILGLAVYLFRSRMTLWAAFPAGILSFAISYGVFLASAEIRFWHQVNTVMNSGEVDCITSKKWIVHRIFSAAPTLHSGESAWVTAHATAVTDGRLQIWSFREGRFVDQENAAEANFECP